ncbi:MAG: hypothetical protein RJA70_1575 [Pseudomonadota bacterium]|jgi:uncharacterized membrane protein YphA (DoxX/SURF4 family)
MTSLLSRAPILPRILLGLIFTVFGLNGFLGFLPMPELPPEGGAFMGALAATGYMLPLIKGTEVVAGVLLLINRFVPLSLVLLAPITVNILLFHSLLAPAPAMPLVLIAAQLFLAYHHRSAFSGVLQSRSSARSAPSAAPEAPLRRAPSSAG